MSWPHLFLDVIDLRYSSKAAMVIGFVKTTSAPLDRNVFTSSPSALPVTPMI